MIRAWYEIKACWWWLAYVVRPYDMLADRRRWFWQPRTPCGRELLEIDRNARAYGWEVGRGQGCGQQVKASPDNPFMDENWRDTWTDR